MENPDEFTRNLHRRLSAEAEVRQLRHEINRLRTHGKPGKGPVKDGWITMEDAPRDGTVVLAAIPVKWKAYHPDSPEAFQGKDGRWVSVDKFGKWANLRGPQPAAFQYTVEYKKTNKEPE
jgi:hypothetical protein